EILDPPVAIGEDLREVEARVDVHDRERDRRRRERLARERQHDRGVLAAGEEQARPRHLRGHLAKDEDALGLEGAQVAQDVRLQGASMWDCTGPLWASVDGGPKVSSPRAPRPGMSL